MARITLRAYLSEIDNLIDRASIDEAIAHCRYILQIYPKNVATYRLLGKAYLERKNYTDASDVLQRVLSVLPDDFVSHIGMSIIREDEGNLDAAIWHMERAFENQPSNKTIQDELKRLYGQRDGVQPPKIHLTRGALARMYARGNLYQQAISELRAALAEDPKRPDLQVLLARMYFQIGQRLEAAETCSTLIGKLPYCLEANQILAEILPGTERARDAEVYSQRIQSLEPYAAFTSIQTPTPERVPDSAISIDRYDGSLLEGIPTISEKPDWASSLGVDLSELTPVGEGLPEWLSTPQSEASTPEYEGEPVESVLDKSEEAGFVEPEYETEPEKKMEGVEAMVSEDETGEEKESPTPFDFEGDSEEESEPVEIPEWLRSMTPSPPSPEEEEISDLPDFLQEPGSQEEDEIPEWLRDIGKGESSEEQKGIFTSETSEEEVEIPSSMQDLEPTTTGSVVDQGDEGGEIQEETPPFEADQEELAEWLSAEIGGEVEEPEIPEWLKQMDETPQDEGPLETPEQVEEDVQETPKAVTELSELENPDQPIEEEGFPEWMEESTDQSGKEIEIPEWLQSMGDEPVEEEAPQEAEPEPTSELDLEVSSPGGGAEVSISDIDQEDQEVALAWLEGLAAKHGASEKELFTSPDERPEELPDWLSDFTQEEMVGEILQEPSSLESEEIEAEPLPDRLEVEASSEAEPDIEAGEIPEWLHAMEEEAPQESQEVPIESQPLEGSPEVESLSAEPTEDFEIPDWLSGIGEEVDSNEIEITDRVVESDQEIPSEEEITPQSTSTTEPEEVLEEDVEEPELIVGDTQPVQISPEPEEKPFWSEGEIVQEEISEVEEPMAPPVETEIQAEEITSEGKAEPEPSAPEPIPEIYETTELGTEESLEPTIQEPSIMQEPEAEETEEVEPVPEWLQEFEEEPEEFPPSPIPTEIEAPQEVEEVVEAEEVTEIEVEVEALEEETPPQVVVPGSAPHILINSASLSQLKQIPGIGSVTAENIIAYREENGPFTSLEQLQHVPGIGPISLESLTPWLKVDQVEVEKPMTHDQVLQRLEEARHALSEENFQGALAGFADLIKESQLLEDIIPGLEQLVEKQPQDLEALQLLGDAYMRDDQLQKALDAYTKAEGLL